MLPKPLKYIKLTLNGLTYISIMPITILDLLDYLGFNKAVIVIDYNGFILEKNAWDKTLIKNDDALEILSIAGGG
jgi:thiamine biosynthesis protein ThiS